MTTTTTQDGVTYVERNYVCHDCSWSWTEVTIKGAKVSECPECEKSEKIRVQPYGEPVKDTKVRGAKKPKSKTKPLDFAAGKAPAITNGYMKKATAIAFKEMEQRGFTDMNDTNLRNGDISAPPINNSVTMAMDLMNRNSASFGGKTAGFTGDFQAGPGASASDGSSVLREIQAGKHHDRLATAHRIHEPRPK